MTALEEFAWSCLRAAYDAGDPSAIELFRLLDEIEAEEQP